MSPHESLSRTKPDVGKCQPFSIECYIYVREDQRQNRKFDPRGEAAIYCWRSTMDNRSSCALYVPGRPRPTFVSTNNVTFGNKCPLAKDSSDFIGNGDTVLDFPPEANVSDIGSSSVDSILDQTETHYILNMTNDSVMSMTKPVFEASFVRAQNGFLVFCRTNWFYIHIKTAFFPLSVWLIGQGGWKLRSGPRFNSWQFADQAEK